MKYFLLMFALLSSPVLASDSAELIGGGLTYHLTSGGAKYFDHKLSTDGRLINNPMLGARLLQENDLHYTAETLYGGENSVGFPMGGAMFSTGWKVGGFYLGGVLGTYLQNDDQVRAAHVIPFKLFEVGSMGVVPVFGIEANYRINLNDRLYLKLNNLISPVLTNTSLSAGVNF